MKRKNPDSSIEQSNSAAKTILEGLAVLGLFNHLATEWTISKIAERLAIPYSTAYRYVTTLEQAGYLIRQESTGAYRLGLPVIELAGVALNQLEVRVHGVGQLDQLADESGLNANMAVLDHGDVFHIAYAVRSEVPRSYTALGRRAVAHCTALGKVLLADLPFSEVRKIIEKYGWRPYTIRSIQDFKTLERVLEEVREQGYALDDGERRLNTRCVAAPVRDRSQRVVAAISVSGTREQITTESIPTLVELVRRHAGLISYRLGYDEVMPVD
jgi:DNA-binding IclR family transcriptional regulator